MNTKIYICNKCLNVISMSKVNIKNNKLICPFCSHTLETDKFIVKQVEELQKALQDKEE